jgi:hypothetical protein
MGNTTGHRPSVRRTVLRHLRERGIAGAGRRHVRGGETLALGIPGAVLTPVGEMTVDGHPCTPAHRTLSDLLRTGSFADRTAVTARHEAGYDPVLYHAYRDFLPPRDKAGKHCVPAPAEVSGRDHLLADLVVYQPGTLPGDEPFRSSGHWNLPGQLEIFQTLTGRVLMLVGGRTREGRPFLYEQICGPGVIMAVPFDVWHVTYVLDGPAVVFNLTTDAGGSGGAARPGEEKYGRAEPIAINVRRRGPRHEYVGSPAALAAWGRPAGAPRTDWLTSLLAPGESLADLHLYASPSRLAALQRRALEAYTRSWPYQRGFQPLGDQT